MEIFKYISHIFFTLIILITSTFIWIQNQDKKIDFITLDNEIYIEELSNPITLSNSSRTSSNLFTISYPPSNMWHVSRHTPM